MLRGDRACPARKQSCRHDLQRVCKGELNPAMPSGTVKYIGPDGDWAFISRDDKQPKVFLHLSEVEKAGLEAIKKGQRWSRSEEHTSELQSLMRISYAVFCLIIKTTTRLK